MTEAGLTNNFDWLLTQTSSQEYLIIQTTSHHCKPTGVLILAVLKCMAKIPLILIGLGFLQNFHDALHKEALR